MKGKTGHRWKVAGIAYMTGKIEIVEHACLFAYTTKHGEWGVKT